MRARRDPAGRRRRIAEAAAELIMETGTGTVTHRQVAAHAGVPLGSTTQYFTTLDDLRAAALEMLVERYDAELASIAAALDAAESPPRVVARLSHEWLSSGDLVRLETVLYTAAIRDASLRPLALRWFDGLVAVLSRHTDPATARAVAVFFDGATLHAVLTGEPLGLDAMTETVTRLWGTR
jgi:TetR/AcrR family transcriptional regulator, regulator of biofilm formation and stress response